MLKHFVLALAVITSVVVWHTYGLRMGLMTTYFLIGAMLVISALKPENNATRKIWIASLLILTAISFHPFVFDNVILWPISVLCSIICFGLYVYFYW